MQWVVFVDDLDNIFATFGKARPTDRILSAAYRHVENLPDDFMRYAKEKLCDAEKLPANLGAYMKNILWPDYKQAYPEKIIRNDRPFCPRCDPNTAGLKRYYSHDGEIHLCACDCCTDDWYRSRFGYWTDFDLEQAGYLLALHERAWNNDRTRKFRAMIFNADWSRREGHTRFLEELEE